MKYLEWAFLALIFTSTTVGAIVFIVCITKEVIALAKRKQQKPSRGRQPKPSPGY